MERLCESPEFWCLLILIDKPSESKTFFFKNGFHQKFKDKSIIQRPLNTNILLLEETCR